MKKRLALLLICLQPLFAGGCFSKIGDCFCGEAPETHPHSIVPAGDENIITYLPPEVLSKAIYFLDPQSMKQIRLVCRGAYHGFNGSGSKERDPRVIFYRSLTIGPRINLYLHPSLLSVSVVKANFIQINSSNMDFLSKNLSSLQKLCFAHCGCFDEFSVAPLAKLQDLQVLSFGGCSNLKDANIITLAKSRSIRELDLSWGAELSNASLFALAKSPVLESLNLTFCKNITNEGIVALAQSLSLKNLNIGYSQQFTDEAIIALSKLPTLEYLEIRSSHQYTDAIIFALAESSSLRILDISFCRQFSPEALAYLQQAKPDLKFHKW